MADLGKKLESLEKPRFSFFTRSLTAMNPSPAVESAVSPKKLALTTQSPPQQSPSHDRSTSFAKLYNSIESVRSKSSSIRGKVKKLCSIFESAAAAAAKNPSAPAAAAEPPLSKLKSSKSFGAESRVSSFLNSSTLRLPGTEDRIVVYLTSLRGVRRTYEDCYAVRTIFRGFRVWVDERDVSMDSAYRRELQSVLGDKNVGLPQVFVRGRYLGGAEVVKRLFETGDLVKILEGFPIRDTGSVCESCGDVRFVPCSSCSGSRKVFDEEEELMKRCTDCNENGLVRCPDCCS